MMSSMMMSLAMAMMMSLKIKKLGMHICTINDIIMSPTHSPAPSDDVEFVSSRGVHFASISLSGGGPHDLQCVREVLKFLIAIINPQDKYVTIYPALVTIYRNNTDRLIGIGLSLVTVMLESTGCGLNDVISLRPHLQDGLCHNLLKVS